MRMNIKNTYNLIYKKKPFAIASSGIKYIYTILVQELSDSFGLNSEGEVDEDELVLVEEIEVTGKAAISISNIHETGDSYLLNIYDNLDRNNGDFIISKTTIENDVANLIDAIQTNMSIYEDVETVEHYYDCDTNLGGPFFGDAEESYVRIEGWELPTYIMSQIARELNSNSNDYNRKNKENIFWEVLIDEGYHEHDFSQKEREIVFLLDNKIYAIKVSYCYCKHSDFRIRIYQPDIELSQGAGKWVNGKYKYMGGWGDGSVKKEDFKKQLNLPGEEFEDLWSVADVLDNPSNFSFNEPNYKSDKTTIQDVSNKTVERIRRETGTDIFNFIEDYDKKKPAWRPAWRTEEYTKDQLEKLISGIEDVGEIISDIDD
jgi:hypothetical protein